MNGKAIVKRMKAAAKAAGCKIWRNEHDVLVLCGGGWCFVCEWGNCPPAVLGCLLGGWAAITLREVATCAES